MGLRFAGSLGVTMLEPLRVITPPGTFEGDGIIMPYVQRQHVATTSGRERRTWNPQNE